MTVVLTRRGVTMMWSDDAEEAPNPLVLQVWDIRPMMSGAGEGHQAADTTTTKRYPMLLSDGDHIQRALLATQMHGIVREEGGDLQKGSIVQLHEFTCNLIHGRRIIIVINLKVLVEECELIGEPKSYDNSSVALQNRAALPTSLSGADQQGVTPMYPNRGPIAKNEAPALLVPIAALNPYSRWTIKARVTSKGELRCYTNSKGVGKFFSFDLIDSEGGEIRATCFDLLADQFYDRIESGKVYLISKGTLRPAQKNFNHLSNEYEIVLQPTSTIQPCHEVDNSFPKQQFNFRTISEIENVDYNSIVDLIGIVSSISPVDLIKRKNGTETHRRTLQLKDMSGRSVEMTLWGNLCTGEGQQLQDMCDSGMHPVLAVKAGRVSDYSRKSVGTIFTSQLFINPDFPEAHRLKEWFSREGMGIAAPSISRDSSMGRADARKTISQIKDEGLGRSGKPDWITVKAIICFVKSDTFCYAACPLMVDGRQCEKKVIDNGNGTWQCERCDQRLQECDYRYLLQFLIQDHTGMKWVTAFEESGEEIMGVSAKNLYYLKFKEQDEVKFSDILKKVVFNQYIFKLKVKEESFNNEQRVKSIVVKAEKLNPSSECRYLLGLIEKLSGESLKRMQQMCGFKRFGTGYSNNTMEFNSGAQPNNYMFGGVASTFKMESMSQTGFRANGCGAAMNQTVGVRDCQQFCNNCCSAGHNFQNCSHGNSGQGQSLVEDFGNRTSNVAMNGVNSSNVCFKCYLPGHWARDCPRSNGVCFKCRLPGHWARDCSGSNGVRF